MKTKFYSLSDAIKDPIYYIYAVAIIWLSRDQYLSGFSNYSVCTILIGTRVIWARWLTMNIRSNAKVTMEIMDEAKIVMIHDQCRIDMLEKENEDLKEKISELMSVGKP